MERIVGDRGALVYVCGRKEVSVSLWGLREHKVHKVVKQLFTSACFSPTGWVSHCCCCMRSHVALVMIGTLSA